MVLSVVPDWFDSCSHKQSHCSSRFSLKKLGNQTLEDWITIYIAIGMTFLESSPLVPEPVEKPVDYMRASGQSSHCSLHCTAVAEEKHGVF